MKFSTFFNTLLLTCSIESFCYLAASETQNVASIAYEEPLRQESERPQQVFEDYSTAMKYINSMKEPDQLVQDKCTPILNWGPSQSELQTGSVPDDLASATTKFEPERVNMSFAIPEVYIPVAPANGSFNSAIKLLSAFENPFGLDEDQEPSVDLVTFSDNNLLIEGLNVSMLNVHFYPKNDSKFSIGATIKNTTIMGQFSYGGSLIFTDSKLAGYYRMSVDNIYLIASSNLTKQTSNKTSGAGQQTKLESKNFNVDITNLGYIKIDVFDTKDSSKPTTNYLLKILQRVLQKTIKKTYYSFESHIKRELESHGAQFLNCELTRFNHLLIEHEKNGQSTIGSNQQGDIARIIGSEIARSQLSSVPLPNFEHQQNILGTMATVQFYNGSLSGLNNTKLNGETRIKLQDQHLFVNSSIGWFDLKPRYNWSLLIGNSKVAISKGIVAFNIKGIDFDAVITKGLKPRTRLVVEQLIIERLDSPKMDISGLPGMNRVTRGMVNFFMGRLKQRISSSIQPALKQQLERSLNKMNLFA